MDTTWKYETGLVVQNIVFLGSNWDGPGLGFGVTLSRSNHTIRKKTWLSVSAICIEQARIAGPPSEFGVSKWWFWCSEAVSWQ
jgi:hypothetical protein